MTARGRREVPRVDVNDLANRLGDRFRDPTPPATPEPTPATSAAPHTAQTSQTPHTDPPPAGGARRGEPTGMTRRTYYYSAEVADALAAAVSRLHHGSHGRLSKHEALDAIIRAGVEQIDAIERRLGSA